ncbi:hypothetical protein [Roseateles sp.]
MANVANPVPIGAQFDSRKAVTIGEPEVGACAAAVVPNSPPL